jgi:hypothetical protein
MKKQKRTVAKQVSPQVDFLAIIIAWSHSLLRLALLAFVIALAYILYGIFSGALASMEPAQMQRVAANLVLMGQVMAAAGLLATVCIVMTTLEEMTFTMVAGIVGAGLMFGMPILVASQLQNAASTPAGVINEWSRNAGMAILFIVGLRVLYAVVDQIANAGARAQAKTEDDTTTVVTKSKEKKRRSLFRLWDPCWDMPYCHPAVREICPAYKAHKSCWRFGYGCNCDPTLIETLIRTGGASTGKGALKKTAEQRITEEAYVRSDLDADTARIGSSERTIPCSKCVIFIEHQRQKFRIINPIAIIATFVGLFFLYKPLTTVYGAVIDFMAALLARLAYGTMVRPDQWVSYLNTPTVKVFFFIFVGMIGLAYVLRAVEWAILKRMII